MKTRIVHTKFWNDKYIGELNPTEKLLFLYLITNEKIGLSGIYECSDRVIQFETGLSSSQIEQIKNKFVEDNKFLFSEGWVKVQNVDKYQVYKGSSNETAKNRELELVPDTVLDYFDRVSTGCLHPADSLRNKKQETRNKKQEIKNKKPANLKNVDNSKKQAYTIEQFLTDFNEIRSYYLPRSKGIQILDKKTKRQFKDLVDMDVGREDMQHTLKALFADQYHRETKWRYCTPEFITRSDKYARFSMSTPEQSIPTTGLSIN